MLEPISPGDPYPLGATWDGSGTNFAVFSQNAESIDLCLFDSAGRETRYELPEVDAFVWHGYLEQAEPGQVYGFRVRGRYDPDAGMRANYAKLLLDPYARAITGEVQWGQAVYSYPLAANDDRVLDRTDSASSMPKSVVLDTAFDWADDHRPRTPWHDTVIYETHVRGLTELHPGVPPPQRGTYAGAGPPGDDRVLPAPGDHGGRAACRCTSSSTTTSWSSGACAITGATTPSASSPPTTATPPRPGQRVVNEFKAMVRALHAAGIEVILDVVYNHTAEGNHLGPTL